MDKFTLRQHRNALVRANDRKLDSLRELSRCEVELVATVKKVADETADETIGLLLVDFETDTAKLAFRTALAAMFFPLLIQPEVKVEHVKQATTQGHQRFCANQGAYFEGEGLDRAEAEALERPESDE